ncbi:MAG: hypothetical protein FWH11_10435 [Micrococcales bacterium]|nr:hypothetical protein [Micrococcales bacterium]
MTLVAVAVPGLPAVADDGVVQVSARLVQVLAEAADDTGTIDTGTETHETSVDLVSMVEVDGRLVALPDGVTVDGATGAEVLLTIEGSGRASGADAVAAAGDATSPATVVEVEIVADGEVMAASASSTLTILPVYWSGSPSPTTAGLRTLGQATATYWSQQSGGAISTSVEVKPWIDARTASGVTVPASCSNEAMATLATQVMAASGYSNPSGSRATGPYRVSVYFPRWNACGWAGLGSVGGAYSWINGYTDPEVLAHEYGHNLGLGHANWYDCGSVSLTLPTASCANREYGDTVDVMGSGTMTGKPGNLNAAMADWLGLARVVKAQPGKTTTATLSPLGSVSSVRAVSVPVPGGTVYVDFRPHVSPDTRQAAWAGVQVRLQVMTSYYPTTYLLDMHPAQSFANPTLKAGESWQVPGSGLKITVTAVNGTTSATVKVSPVSSVTLGSDLGFVPVSPTRLVDTRGGSKVGAGKTLDVQVAGVGGVPSDARAVALNVTAVDATGRTFLRAWPLGVTEPSSSTLNVHPGATVAAATVLGVGSGGKVRLRNNTGTVNVIVDVTGYYVSSGGAGFSPLPSAVRLYDSRTSGGHAAMSTKRLQVTGKGGIPSNATAVMVNVTAASARGPGHVSVVPAGGDVRGTSAVNLWPGADVANRATVPLSGGKIDVYLHSGPAGVIIDVVGWYGPSGELRLTPVAPQRLVDTRVKGGALKGRESRTVALRDAVVTTGRPAAALATITATQQTTNTHMTVGAAGAALPTTSDMNTGPGRDQAALALFVWNASGRSVVYNNAGSTHLVIDVTAVFR